MKRTGVARASSLGAALAVLIAAALTLPGGAATQANDGLPSRWFGTVESHVVIESQCCTSTENTSARVTFALSGVSRRQYRNTSYTEYSYRPTGTLEASYHSVSGGCTWKGAGTVRVTRTHGLLRVIVVKAAGKKTHVEYGTFSGGPYGIKDPTIQVKLTCPDHGSTNPFPIHWLGIPHGSKSKTTARRLTGTYTYVGQAEGSRTWCLVRRQSDLGDCPEELEAVANVAGSRLRAATRTLDGSKSTGDITGYSWTFSSAPCSGPVSGACAGACNAVGPKPGAKKSGERVTIKPLCTIVAKLTVTDGQEEDSDTVEVAVAPRSEGWRTRVFHRWIPTPAGSTPRTPPSASCISANECSAAIDGGKNLPDPQGCAGEEFVGSRIFCPLLGSRRTWSGRGYRLGAVADPGGPFDGYVYVKESTLVVRRIAYINPNLLSGSWYDYNKAQGAKVDEFIAAVKGHEGWGAPGKPRTGHSQIMRDVIADPTGGHDPRREIERLFAPRAAIVQADADKKIKELDTFVDKESDDPLERIWVGDLYFYDPVHRFWVVGPITIP